MVSATTISAAARILRQGGLVAFPTETVYGLGADATNGHAVARIFSTKKRPEINPLITHVATLDEASSHAQLPPAAIALAHAFWPGPLTIVAERRAGTTISALCSAGLNSVALRVPDHPVALALIRETGRPLAGPSANPSGRISPTTADHVRAVFGTTLDMIVDAGPCAVGVESTVVHFDGEVVRLLRPGGVTREEIEEVLGYPLHGPKVGEPLAGPGLLSSHYAPNAPLRLNALDARSGEIHIGFGPSEFKVDDHFNLSPSADLVEAAANLFRHLHDADALCPEGISVAPIPAVGLGEAINDRLRRAAAPRPQ